MPNVMPIAKYMAVSNLDRLSISRLDERLKSRKNKQGTGSGMTMPTRNRRPGYSHAQQGWLLEAMRAARRAIIECGEAERFGTPKRAKCDAALAAIDALAEELTGKADFYHLDPH